MTLLALRTRDSLMAVRFAWSRAWETLAAVRTLVDDRALVLAGLDQPLSTTALAALLELSPAGASRHLLALRDNGLVSATRHGHEVRYRRTALLHGGRP